MKKSNQSIVYEYLKTCRHGAGNEAIAAGTGLTSEQVASATWHLKDIGRLVSVRSPKGRGTQRRVYFMPEFAPAQEPLRSTAPTSFAVHSKRVVLDKDAPADFSKAKVTVCPGFTEDKRFAFQPDPGWRGQITSDWLNGRLREVSHG